MKKLFNGSTILFLCVLFTFTSCVSSEITEYKEISEDAKTVYVQLDSNTNIVSGGGYFSTNGTAMFYDIESGVLNTLKNRLMIQSSLTAKGYKVSNSIDEADLIMQGGFESSEIKTTVLLAIFDKESNDLLAICKGAYGMGLDLQDDINGALKKALEKIPSRDMPED